MRPRQWLAILLIMIAPPLAGATQEARAMPDTRTQDAMALMASFAERTGLVSDRPQRRYLWTDAFAVCNFLGLAQATGRQQQLELALGLIDRVHHALGRHRADDSRRGWISGLEGSLGEAHPTRGGLRIGKALPERGPDQVLDERLEWDRDGQYFHYLTRWMHALDQTSRTTGRARFNLWARELADTAFQAFTYRPFGGTGPRRMYWKMSIDLSRPLVSSMGQQDPLDGYTTTVQLRSTAAMLPQAPAGPELEHAISGFAEMLRRGDWATADPLGIGGLLVDAWRVAQLREQGTSFDRALLERLLGAAAAGLQHYARSGELQRPAGRRLAFRELGLAIGLSAVERLQQASGLGTGSRSQLKLLLSYQPLGEQILSFWHDPGHRQTEAWSEHRDINEVMLATALAPSGYLDLRVPPRTEERR
ncbi:MAG: hypothetical protein PVI91_00020 [Gammaproteobacteria bacterium]